MRTPSLLYALAVALMGLLLACNTPLERQGVPISLGLWCNSESLSDSIARNLPAELRLVDSLGLTALTLHIPFTADSTPAALPRLDLDSAARQRLLAFAGLAAQSGIALHISFEARRQSELFKLPMTEGRWPVWRAQYIAEATGLLIEMESIGAIIPWVVLGRRYSALGALQAPYLQELAAGFGAQLGEDVKLTYAVWQTEVPEQDWRGLDAIGIDFNLGGGADYKRWARQENPQAGTVADSLGLPVYISHANLIGQDKLLLLKNALRFWPEGVPVAGLTLNTLYPRSAWTDRQTYFALDTTPAVRAYLWEYLEASRNNTP